MHRNTKGQFVRADRPKGFMSSREALAQELAAAGKALTKSVCQKTVERARTAAENAKRILGNAERTHLLEGTEVTKSLENKAWRQWRDAVQAHQLALQGVLDEKVRLLRVTQQLICV